jgi:hypothetical protein
MGLKPALQLSRKRSQQMHEVSVVHHLDCDEATFWNNFFLSAEFLRELYVEKLKFRECVLSQESAAGGLLARKVRYQPPLDTLPQPIRKAYGDALAYDEIGTLDRASGRYQFQLSSSTLGNIEVSGQVWCEQETDGRLGRHFLARLNARVPWIGPIIEQRIARDPELQASKFAKLVNRHMATGGARREALTQVAAGSVV